MPDIGATLREARIRARIDVSEIESQTKIRAKYLRAMENEEWNLLPGPAYVRSFLRTYSDALGLDSKVLLEQYRQGQDRPSEADLMPIVAPGGRPGGRSSRARPSASRGFVTAVAVGLLVIAVLIYAVLQGGGSAPQRSAAKPAPVRPATLPAHHTSRSRRATEVVLQLRPSAPVYVCLLGAGGRKLIPGVILQPGSTQPVYRSARFSVTLGNSAVVMRIDGRTQIVPPSGNATGYSITTAGRRLLPAARLPRCA